MSQNDPFGPDKMEAYQEPEHLAHPPEHRGPGCLFWGCLISGIVFLVLVILMVALAFFLRGKLIDSIRDYTEPQAVELPEIQLTREERGQVVGRWDDFKQALEEGRQAEVVLDGDEFNVVAQELVPEAAEHAYFAIEGDELVGQVSIPVEAAGKMLVTDQLQGRHFNASGTFDVFLRNGLLVLQIKEAEVKGEPVPDTIMDQFRNQNLAENMANDPEQRELLSKLERIEIQDGRIIITSKGAADGDEEAAPAEAEAEAEAPDDAPDSATDAEPEAAPDAPEPAEAEAAPDASEPAEAPAPPAEPGSDDAPAEPESEPSAAA